MKQWDKRFGGKSWDELTCFQQTTDRGYILGGYSSSDISGDKTGYLWGNHDYWIVKIDSNGNKQWDADYGRGIINSLYSLQQTKDGGYILGGYTENSGNNLDYMIIKIDSLGAQQWYNVFGGQSDDYLTSVKQTKDGGYILGGYSMSGISGDKTQATRGTYDYWIVKTDSVGNKQWDKDLGGSDGDFLLSLQQTTDGGYILGGYSFSDSSGDKTANNKDTSSNDLFRGDYWIVKTDSLGNKQWDKDFGGAGDDFLYSLLQTNDGGYVLGGSSQSGVSGDKTHPLWGSSINYDSDFWIIKTDSLGNKLWDKDYGGTLWEDELGSISQTNDGGFLIAGTSYSPVGGDKTESSQGTEQTWIVKTDSLGVKEWDKTIFTRTHDEVGYAVQTKDGCYAVANCTFADTAGYKTQTSRGDDDYWIIKFCDSLNSSIVKPTASFQSSDTVLCLNDCINFTDLSTGNPTNWQWSFAGAADSTSADRNPQNICYSKPGIYNVSLIAYNSGGSDTLTLNNYITVHPAPPVPNIVLSDDTLFCSTDTSYIHYQWYIDSTIIASATDTFLVITHGGNYNVKVTNSYGCTIAVGINIVGVKEFSQSNFISISPNPAESEVRIKSLTEIERVEIYNLLGQKTSSAAPLQNRVMNTAIDVRELPAGIYLVQVTTDKRRWTGRFVKE